MSTINKAVARREPERPSGRARSVREAIRGDRPPSYLAIDTLARELDVSETTVRELVDRGVLPPPIRLSTGTVRWNWAEVQAALASLRSAGTVVDFDPYLQGVANVKTKASGRDAA